MEKREDALREGLEKNEEETLRWETYIKENETAIDNLSTFSKKLTVEVMVPIGKKAFMPGHLIHTNEVLMGHFQDYFSKCSAYTATEICNRRIENGKKHLEQLEAERKLFQNKLEKPYLDGVLPSSEQVEIIEDYDEEKEKLWKEEHRQRVKEAKLKEKQELDQINKETQDKLSQDLEEEELLKEMDEELAEHELEPLEKTQEIVDRLETTLEKTQEIVNRLIAGEINLPPPKNRVAHNVKRHDSVQLKPPATKVNSRSENPTTDYIMKPLKSTNNPLFTSASISEDENDSDTSIASDTPEEIRLIEKQAEYLPPGDRAGFYQYQLQIVNQKIATCSFSNNKELEEKLQLFKIRDHLDELIEIIEEGASSETESQAAELEKEATEVEKSSGNPLKRRISFALEDQLLEFRKNETVAQMMPAKSPTEEKPPRDIIRLDEPIIPVEVEAAEPTPAERRKTILEKVEENLKTQSLEDADLVNRIIDSSSNLLPTLRIKFKHSTALPTSSNSTQTDDVPSTPADLYKMIYPEENQDPPANDDNNFYLKESYRDRAYVDVRSEFLTPNLSDNQSKSILKNKTAVQRETHIAETEQKPKAPLKKPEKTKQDLEQLSAYNKVMSEVIENPATEPDPLPDEKFVDMHTPKKRISRFKQMRNENK